MRERSSIAVVLLLVTLFTLLLARTASASDADVCWQDGAQSFVGVSGD